MKKVILIGGLSLCLALSVCGCNKAESESIAVLPTTKPQSESTQQQSDSMQPESNSTQSQSTSEQPEDPSLEDEKYLEILCETLGADYLEGRSTMRSMGEDGGVYIDGVYCAMYAIGTNKPEQFVVEEWFAISSQEDATVYEYDVVMDTWNVYGSVAESFAQADDVDVDNCIYMLNEYLSDRFAVEFSDAPDDAKQAIFKEENSTAAPEQLIGILEEIPDGYYPDPAARSYYPVYNFDSYDSLIAHFSNYFTANVMVDIEAYLAHEFFEIDGTLYMVRGDRGYHALWVDFDAIDKSQFASDGIVMVGTLLFDEKDATYQVEFAYEDGILKIDQVG